MPSVALADCLQRFTQPEQLGSDEKTFCDHCHSLQVYKFAFFV